MIHNSPRLNAPVSPKSRTNGIARQIAKRAVLSNVPVISSAKSAEERRVSVGLE